jgi:hypothetical protein
MLEDNIITDLKAILVGVIRTKWMELTQIIIHSRVLFNMELDF